VQLDKMLDEGKHSEKFRIVCSLLNLLYPRTIDLTLENFCKTKSAAEVKRLKNYLEEIVPQELAEIKVRVGERARKRESVCV